MNNSVEIITVNYCTPELIKRLVDSVRKFEGNIHIRVIDGSDKEPYMSQMRKIKGIELNQLGYNIHHGRGMDYGMKTSKYDWCLIMDSDVTIKRPIIKKILEATMAKGKMIAGKKLDSYIRDKVSYAYYSLAFLLVNREFYMQIRKFGAKFKHDGAPGYKIYRYIHDNKMKVCINIFKHLGITREDYVKHPRGGTRIKFKNKLRANVDIF